VRLAPSTKEKIDFFLRHPLTLSLTGMLLGSLLIPWIVGRSSKEAVVADTRLKQALQVMATSNGVDATINKIETAFEKRLPFNRATGRVSSTAGRSA
jgi:exopolysaccharide biosynthesis protein